MLQLLADVYSQVGTTYEVIVVDDHCPDNTASAVSERFPQTVVLRSEVNCGPAVSRNRGIRQARGAIVIGFDSDVTLGDPTLLRRVVDAFERLPEASALAFRILSADGQSEDAPRWWHPLPLAQYAGRSFVTHYFSGTGYAIRRDAVLAAGLFPELLFMHYEEVELAFRILDNGGSIGVLPRSDSATPRASGVAARRDPDVLQAAQPDPRCAGLLPLAARRRIPGASPGLQLRTGHGASARERVWAGAHIRVETGTTDPVDAAAAQGQHVATNRRHATRLQSLGMSVVRVQANDMQGAAALTDFVSAAHHGMTCSSVNTKIPGRGR